jgi:2-keto-4-pentenoate hydratase/2-oxohepta-3-ene-1,7-dioic acid hydratase in catechol pathway
VAGNWPQKKPFRRAAQFDGVFPQRLSRALTPEDFRELLAYISAHRTRTTSFDVVASGSTSGTDKAGDAAQVASFAQAGATWWVEGFDPLQTFEQVRERIGQGPPRLS